MVGAVLCGESKGQHAKAAVTAVGRVPERLLFEVSAGTEERVQIPVGK